MADQAAKRVLDFTNVTESSGVNPRRVPAGDYIGIVRSVTEKESKQGNPQWVYVIGLKDQKTAAYPYYCQLEEKALWKIRNLFLAAGIDVPKKRVNVDPNRIVGREVGISLDDDEYEGKLKSVIVAVFPSEEVTDSPKLKDDSDAEPEDTSIPEDDAPLEDEVMEVDDL